MSIKNFGIYCIDESKFVSGWGTEKPTKCYNDGSHNVNLDSVNTISEITEKKVIIENEKNPFGMEATNGNYKCDTLVMDCEPNATTYMDVSKKIPICLNTVQFDMADVNHGDIVSVIAIPDTIVGGLQQPVYSGVTSFPMYTGLVPYLQKGYYLKLRETTESGTKENKLGYITQIDTTNMIVYFSDNVVDNFNAGTKIIMEKCIVDNYYIYLTSRHEFGKSKIGSSYIPKNMVMRVYYTNNSNDAKKFVFHYEYYY